MKGTWSPSVLLAVWGALGRLGLGTELEIRYDNGDNRNEIPNSIPRAEDFVRLRGHTVAAIGDYLYIDGGELIERVKGVDTYEVGTTWSIDLAKSWTNETVKIQSIPKSSPGLSRQTHWIDASTKSLYTWGGFTLNGSSPSRELWQLMTNGAGGGTWSQVTQRDYLAFSKLKGTFGTAFTQSKDAGYAFGGAVMHSSDGSIDKESPGYATPGLVSYNFHTGEWVNSSTSSYGGYGTSINARAEFVPFGPNGLLLFLGGAETPVDATNETIVEVNWNSITMVDPVTNQWYKQSTSGTKPPTVESHCSVGVPGPNGTYEIFMYGGISGQLSGATSEVYVLSLPGFVFFEGPKDAPSRSDHQCAIVGKGQRQMLSQGGINGENRTYTGTPTADPWKYGIGVLDMTELRWTDSYNPDAPDYDSPAQVKNWYEAGNLQRMTWDSKEVADLFLKEPSHAPMTVPTQRVSASSSTGQIAGIAIGCVFGVAAIGILAYFLIRRNRRMRSRPDTSNSQRHLAPLDCDPELVIQSKPEPVPKDDYSPRYYQYSAESIQSAVPPYSPTITTTAIFVDAHEYRRTWRSELPGQRHGFVSVQSVELPCTQPRSSESKKTDIQTAYELPVPIESFRVELPDQNYSR
ncbi:hypothetical protein GGS21DRAFT_492277 [Xylaria nigripes]|nr:hypothetical protein GGS21DRAFT_492277 [Xylaria nigripes]